MPSKPKDIAKFNEALYTLDDVMKELNIPYHLNSGSALGAHREKGYIPHDDDIDVGVFYDDIPKRSQVDQLLKLLKQRGFKKKHDEHGSLKTGFELGLYHKNGTPIDIFWTYNDTYKGYKISYIASYYGKCDDLPKGMCVWIYRRFKPVRLQFYDRKLYSWPLKTVRDSYGKNWKTPIKYDYIDMLENKELAFGLAEDFFKYNGPEGAKRWIKDKPAHDAMMKQKRKQQLAEIRARKRSNHKSIAKRSKSRTKPSRKSRKSRKSHKSGAKRSKSRKSGVKRSKSRKSGAKRSKSHKSRKARKSSRNNRKSHARNRSRKSRKSSRKLQQKKY